MLFTGSAIAMVIAMFDHSDAWAAAWWTLGFMALAVDCANPDEQDAQPEEPEGKDYESN